MSKKLKNLIKNKLERVGSIMNPMPNPKNLREELQRMATRSTAEYISQRMSNIQSVPDLFSVHEIAIDCVSIVDGLVLEFGVFEGRTANYIASKGDWILDGFDSFEGLPESWRDGFEKGFFSISGLPTVRSNVRLHKGWFDEAIPIYLKKFDLTNAPISYLHVDCDLYSSTNCIFQHLGDKIISGTIIVFDEYFNYFGWESGEFLSFKEFVEKNNIKYRYITYNYNDEQVAVEIL